MNRQLKPYKEYKPIDYDYVDKLPEDWNLVPNIALFEQRSRTGHINEDLLTVSSYRGIVKTTDFSDRKDRSSTDKSNYQLVEKGDIVYNPMLMWAGAIGCSDFRGIVSPDYNVIKPIDKLNPHYFHYLFRTNFYKNYSKRFSYGIISSRLRLYYKHFKRMYSIVPPLKTQNKIVEFLNQKTEKANKFIKKQEKTIELLKEQKKAIIDKAVTKGLDSNVIMKDSGIEWLGEIPEHWTQIKIKHLLSNIDYGLSVSGQDEGDYKYLNMGNIQSGKIKYKGCSYLDDVDDFYILRKNDILFNRTNSLELVAKTGLFTGDYSEKVTFSSYLVRLRCKSNILPEYLNYYLNSSYFINYARSLSLLSVNQANLNPTKYTNIKIAIPNVLEQERILKYLKEKTTKLDKAISKTKKEIEGIKEYIDSLIYYVVTGQLSVEKD